MKNKTREFCDYDVYHSTRDSENTMIPQSQPTRNVIFLLFDDDYDGGGACVFSATFTKNTILTNYHLPVSLLFDGWTTVRRVNVTSLKRAVVCCKCNVYVFFFFFLTLFLFNFNSSIQYYIIIYAYPMW